MDKFSLRVSTAVAPWHRKIEVGIEEWSEKATNQNSNRILMSKIIIMLIMRTFLIDTSNSGRVE